MSIQRYIVALPSSILEASECLGKSAPCTYFKEEIEKVAGEGRGMLRARAAAPRMTITNLTVPLLKPLLMPSASNGNVLRLLLYARITVHVTAILPESPYAPSNIAWPTT
jgi:hypothetical protein